LVHRQRASDFNILSLMNNKAFIIDDDQLCHLITRHLIKTEDLAQQITCFYEAEEALQLLISGLPDNWPDMIFLDLNMPQMNGWQFLDALTPYQGRIQSKTRIFILTSSLDNMDLEKYREYPFVSRYFLKPLQPTDLEAIRGLLKDESQ
jgi:CheY-like chemotaxis protein